MVLLLPLVEIAFTVLTASLSRADESEYKFPTGGRKTQPTNERKKQAASTNQKRPQSSLGGHGEEEEQPERAFSTRVQRRGYSRWIGGIGEEGIGYQGEGGKKGLSAGTDVRSPTTTRQMPQARCSPMSRRQRGCPRRTPPPPPTTEEATSTTEATATATATRTTASTEHQNERRVRPVPQAAAGAERDQPRLDVGPLHGAVRDAQVEGAPARVRERLYVRGIGLLPPVCSCSRRDYLASRRTSSTPAS